MFMGIKDFYLIKIGSQRMVISTILFQYDPRLLFISLVVLGAQVPF